MLTGEFPGSSIPVLFGRLSDKRLLTPLPDTVIKRKCFEPETVYVPQGEFLMGSSPGEEVPDYEARQDAIQLPAYWTGRYPVTNREYWAFVQRNDRQRVPRRVWSEGQPPEDKLDHPMDKLDHPVAGVAWYDAVAYCEWLSAQTGRMYALPSEAP